jgi:tRNA(Ile)-lysidine synthase
VATSNGPTKQVVEALRSCFENHDIEHAVIGYSGGVDSHVLLHALATHLPSLSVEAVHVNHQQSEQAASWEEHTQGVCAALKVPYHCYQVNPVVKSGDSLEACLRDARYAALKERVYSRRTALLVAHHADDQAETVLLRLLRGSGPAGLGAMQESQPFAQGYLLRPFLSLPRSVLLEYAQQHQLSWIEDDSNTNERFDRNYLRQTVMPVLQARWPSLNKTIPRTAMLCQENEKLLGEIAKADGVTADNRLDWSALKNMSAQRQCNALRYWLFSMGLKPPSQAQLRDFFKQVEMASPDRTPTLNAGQGVVRYYRKQLYCSPVVESMPFQLEWDLSSTLELPVGQLMVQEVMGRGFSKSKLSLPITVATRSGGERIKLGKSHCHQSLKNCWQQWGVPPWLREHYPLLYVERKLLAVPGYACASELAAKPDELGLLVWWEHDKYLVEA